MALDDFVGFPAPDTEGPEEEEDELEEEEDAEPIGGVAPHMVYVDGDRLDDIDDMYPEGNTHVSVSFPDAENGYYEDDRPKQALDWANSANIRLDEDDDAIHVAISCGDPRGSFVMTIRRLDDGTLIMHLPYPEQSFLHLPLTPLHPGTYKIGD